MEKKIRISREVNEALKTEGVKIILEELKKAMIEWNNVLGIVDENDLLQKQGGTRLVNAWLDRILGIKFDIKNLGQLPVEQDEIYTRLQED